MLLHLSIGNLTHSLTSLVCSWNFQSHRAKISIAQLSMKNSNISFWLYWAKRFPVEFITFSQKRILGKYFPIFNIKRRHLCINFFFRNKQFEGTSWVVSNCSFWVTYLWWMTSKSCDIWIATMWPRWRHTVGKGRSEG